MNMGGRHQACLISVCSKETMNIFLRDICGETALYIHGLTDREYGRIEVTVPQGYNAVHLRKKKIQVRSLKEDLYELGETVVESGYGNQIVAYDKERAICDAVINRKS